MLAAGGGATQTPYANHPKIRQLEVGCAEIQLPAERKVGQLIAQQRETVGLNLGMAGGASRASSGVFTEPHLPPLPSAEIPRVRTLGAEDVFPRVFQLCSSVMRSSRGSLSNRAMRWTAWARPRSSTGSP